MILVTALGT